MKMMLYMGRMEGVIILISFFMICSCSSRNYRAFDNRIWETTNMQNSDIIGKWLHPFGDRVWEITETQIIEHFYNGDKTTSKIYLIGNEEFSFLDSVFSFQIFQDDIMRLRLKKSEVPLTWFPNASEYPPQLLHEGFFHRINNIEVSALHERRYEYTYSFGKWAYRWFYGYHTYSAPSYWLRTINEPNSLHSLDFIDNKRVMVQRIIFVEEDRDDNSFRRFVSYNNEECEYEIAGSELIIKTGEGYLNLRIVNKRAIFHALEKSLFIYNLDGEIFVK